MRQKVSIAALASQEKFSKRLVSWCQMVGAAKVLHVLIRKKKKRKLPRLVFLDSML